MSLQQDGWRALTIWEFALRGRRRLDPEKVLRKADAFLMGKRHVLQVTGGRTRSASG